jgi:hypothetical protein
LDQPCTLKSCTSGVKIKCQQNWIGRAFWRGNLKLLRFWWASDLLGYIKNSQYQIGCPPDRWFPRVSHQPRGKLSFNRKSSCKPEANLGLHLISWFWLGQQRNIGGESKHNFFCFWRIAFFLDSMYDFGKLCTLGYWWNYRCTPACTLFLIRLGSWRDLSFKCLPITTLCIPILDHVISKLFNKFSLNFWSSFHVILVQSILPFFLKKMRTTFPFTIVHSLWCNVAIIYAYYIFLASDKY